jgi:diguanylate cyclase
MFRIVGCLTEQHDYRLVLLAAIICAATSVAAFGMYSRVEHAQGRMRLGWLFMTGVCTASGIWATHFVAMLAYQSAIPVAYEPALTAGSLFIAIGATTLGYLVCSGGSKIEVAIGGAIIGLGISLMHFTGMQALVLAGRIEWDMVLVTAAIFMGAALASGATTSFHRLTGLHAVAAGAGLFTLAICAMHFTAMGAALIVPDPTVTAPWGFSANAPMMALAIAGLTALVIVAGLAAALLDRQTSLDSVERIRELVDAANEGIVIANDGVIVNVNRRISEMCGRPIEGLVGKLVSGDLLAAAAVGPLGDKSRVTEAVLKSVDGACIPVEVVSRPFRSDVSGNEVYAIRDLTERRRNEAQITYMAHHDALTDLPNRVLLRERLDQALTHVAKGETLAVVRLGLDRFKEVNDAFGHAIGDALLKAAAQRLRDCVRHEDTLARVGGDEFTILQQGGSQPIETTTVAERILDALSVPFSVEGQDVMVGASLGIALSAHGKNDPDELLRNADMALRRAKSEGRGTYCFFEKEMNERMTARRVLETGLRTALTNGEFELYYQPIQNLERNEISGLEALLRWKHPERGMISPTDFIPLAEETGLIVAIGEWVLREACMQAVRWPQHIKVAINLSPKQFKSPAIVQTVVSAVVAAGIAPSRVELEITETALLEESEQTLDLLRQLQNFGVRIALDDFGTGYSSLSYLRSFPFNKLKIDRSFVNALSNDAEHALPIVRAIIQMGRSLGMSTTAEGVETNAQLEAICAEGCTEVQGYLFSGPKPADEVAELLVPTSMPTPLRRNRKRR